MMNAYTVKKVLPRLLIAVIAINLSYYLMIIAIDITNIIGDGVGGAILQPFGQANSFDPGGGASLVISVVAAIGVVALFKNFRKSSTGNRREDIGSVVGYLMLTVVIPAVLIIIAIFAVLSIRMALMILLAIASPIAFAAMVLPSTEGIFKKWWNLFLTTLMIYPIVMVMFAMGKVMTIIFGWNAGGTSSGAVAETISGLLAIFSQFIPLALIPFSFKLAGGAIGAIGNFATGKAGGLKTMIQGDSRDAGSRISKARDRYRSKRDDRRVGLAEAGHDRADALNERARLRRGRGGIFNRAAGLGLSARARGAKLGYGSLADVEPARSALNKREREARELHTGFGRDNTRRGSTTRLDLLGNDSYRYNRNLSDKENVANGALWRYKEEHAVDQNGKQLYRDASGGLTTEKTGEKVMAETRQRELRTLGGAWVSESDAKAGHARFGGNQAAMQQNIEYEMSKASNKEEFTHLNKNLGGVLQKNGFTKRGAGDVLKGSGYSQQGRVLQYKHGSINEDSAGNLVFEKNTGKVLADMYYNKPSYSAQQFNAETINDLTEMITSGTASADDIEMLDAVHKNLTSQSIGEEDGQARLPGMGGNSGTAATAAAIKGLGDKLGELRTLNGGPPSGPASPAGSGLVLPGDDDFRVPPGSRPS
jgi:hypothetical protein